MCYDGDENEKRKRCRFRHNLASHYDATVTVMYKKIVISCCLLAVFPSAVMTMTTSPILSATRQAMKLSNKANVDPTFADEACRLWHSILCVDDDTIPLPLSAMSAAHALYASTLARVGRDKEALIQHDNSLSYLDTSNFSKDEADVLLAKSKSLQRLMRYQDAISVLNTISSRCGDSTHANTPENSSWLSVYHSEAVERAALCSMRVGDLDSSIHLLEDFANSIPIKSLNRNIAGMLGASLLLKTSNTEKDNGTYLHATKLLKHASETAVSPIYNWIYDIICSVDEQANFRPFAYYPALYAAFTEANNSPFDDPNLVQLDNKVNLHNMINEYKSFSPKGYVLPIEIDSFASDWIHDDSDKLAWMLKDVAGYGSHGNLISTTSGVLSLFGSGRKRKEAKLCQQIIHPPLLLNGLKFSLRVYVVYFPEGVVLTSTGDQMLKADIYISTEGLVKFASALYDEESSSGIDNQYMTNSGRGDGRSSKQVDFLSLRRQFNECNIGYEEMWAKIRTSVQLVMKRYTSEQFPIDGETRNSYNCAYFGLPKILGFDYMLDRHQIPWLLEVNRFPGLDPRADSDTRVKRTVQYDAWMIATERIGMSTEYMKQFSPQDYQGFSLEKLK